MSSHTSTAMMSAPSSASRMACSRPWPRAAPVMNATLPATLPTLLSVMVAFRLGNLTDAGGYRRDWSIACFDGRDSRSGVGSAEELEVHAAGGQQIVRSE